MAHGNRSRSNGVVLTAKIDAGFPAKPHLFKPLEEKPKDGKETEVWKLVKRRLEYVIAKGYEYECFGSNPSSEIFEGTGKRVSGDKKPGHKVERKEVSAG